MRDVFKGGEIVKADAPAQKQQITVDTFAATVGQYDCEIHFTYCTEMIITKKADADDSSKLRAYLETIGDCVVVVEDDEIIKVHVHTNDPGKAIQKGLEFGYINLPKIENMKLQHKARQKKQSRSSFLQSLKSSTALLQLRQETALSQCSEISVLTASLRADRP